MWRSIQLPKLDMLNNDSCVFIFLGDSQVTRFFDKDEMEHQGRSILTNRRHELASNDVKGLVLN